MTAPTWDRMKSHHALTGLAGKDPATRTAITDRGRDFIVTPYAIVRADLFTNAPTAKALRSPTPRSVRMVLDRGQYRGHRLTDQMINFAGPNTLGDMICLRPAGTRPPPWAIAHEIRSYTALAAVATPWLTTSGEIAWTQSRRGRDVLVAITMPKMPGGHMLPFFDPTTGRN